MGWVDFADGGCFLALKLGRNFRAISKAKYFLASECSISRRYFELWLIILASRSHRRFSLVGFAGWVVHHANRPRSIKTARSADSSTLYTIICKYS